MWVAGIDEQTVDEILSVSPITENASTFADNGPEIRSSKVSWLTGHDWILDLLYKYADHANQVAFQSSIYKKAPIQFTEYHASEGGHYSWHHDVDWNRDDGLDRKLSVTLQLSDPSEYEGGDFSFSEVLNPDADQVKTKGTVLVFPSYLTHAVSPVTSGVRRSLVAWFEGPKWR